MFLVSAPCHLYSQEVNIVFESGLAAFKMSDLKTINEMVVKSLPFDVRITEDYPDYYYYKPSLTFTLGKSLSAGAVLYYQSTGSRVSRSDYSGEYLFDSRIRALSPAVLVCVFHSANKFRIGFTNETGVNFSKLQLNEHIEIYTQSEDNKASFVSTNLYYTPSVNLSYLLLNCRVGISAGYMFDIKKGSLSNTESKRITLELADDKDAYADWTGFRLGLSLSYNLLLSARK